MDNDIHYKKKNHIVIMTEKVGPHGHVDRCVLRFPMSNEFHTSMNVRNKQPWKPQWLPNKQNIEFSNLFSNHVARDHGVWYFSKVCHLIILATLALPNTFCIVGGMKRVITDVQTSVSESFTLLQILLCGLLVLINLPVYQGLFLRRDNGSLPASSLAYSSIMFALLGCAIALY